MRKGAIPCGFSEPHKQSPFHAPHFMMALASSVKALRRHTGPDPTYCITELRGTCVRIATVTITLGHILQGLATYERPQLSQPWT